MKYVKKILWWHASMFYMTAWIIVLIRLSNKVLE